MKTLPVILVMAALSGCASTASPTSYFGNYYMAGDKNCKRISARSLTRVMCHDKNGNETGYRDAMNSRDMQIYQYRAAENRAQLDSLNESIADLGRSADQWGQQFRQQGQSFVAPQVQPVSPNRTPYRMTYTQVGDAIRSSNGVTYRWVGSTFLGTDGSRCQVAGPQLVCWGQ